MSSAAISELVARHGVRRVAEGFRRQGVDFKTAHLLILGYAPRLAPWQSLHDLDKRGYPTPTWWQGV